MWVGAGVGAGDGGVYGRPRGFAWGRSRTHPIWGGRVAGAPTTSGVFLYTLVTVATVRFLCGYFQATAGPATSRYVEWVGSLVFQNRLIHRDFWGTCLPPPWHSELFDFVAKPFLVLKLHTEVYNLSCFKGAPNRRILGHLKSGAGTPFRDRLRTEVQGPQRVYIPQVKF